MRAVWRLEKQREPGPRLYACVVDHTVLHFSWFYDWKHDIFICERRGLSTTKRCVATTILVESHVINGPNVKTPAQDWTLRLPPEWVLFCHRGRPKGYLLLKNEEARA
jgi:hypothetical protein